MSSPYEQFFEFERRIEAERKKKIEVIDAASANLREWLTKYSGMIGDLAGIADLLREVAVTDASQVLFESSREPRKTRYWYVLTALEGGPLPFGDMLAKARLLGFDSTGDVYRNFKDGVNALRKQGKVIFDPKTKLYRLAEG